MEIIYENSMYRDKFNKIAPYKACLTLEFLANGLLWKKKFTLLIWLVYQSSLKFNMRYHTYPHFKNAMF